MQLLHDESRAATSAAAGGLLQGEGLYVCWWESRSLQRHLPTWEDAHGGLDDTLPSALLWQHCNSTMCYTTSCKLLSGWPVQNIQHIVCNRHCRNSHDAQHYTQCMPAEHVIVFKIKVLSLVYLGWYWTSCVQKKVNVLLQDMLQLQVHRSS